ncbi:aspartyl protease family protein [Candidatus Bathyarchaeota archaeon]|nr:aspartyl protease family protein [Candidatus Bathyarchaeota archaeon]
MGLIHKKVKLTGEGGELEVNALIDTGTKRLLVPKNIADKIGIKPMFKVRAELADGTIKDVGAGPIYVEIMGRGAPDWVAIVEKGEVCIGAETLETLGLAVDPTTGEIRPIRKFIWRI